MNLHNFVLQSSGSTVSIMISTLLRYGAVGVGATATLYVALLGLLTTAWFQAHVVYLHAIQMTWGKDLNTPEIFGFLHNQVTPFNIQQGGSENLHVWHILPVELYRRHEEELLAEPSGLVADFPVRTAFRLLRDDPEALLVIRMHGAGGTVAPGYRTPNYRALTAAAPDKLHVLTSDYRGFGRTPGRPTERGLILDAIAVVDWALNVAKIPPERIVIFSQSLGTAVNAAIAEHFAQQVPSIVFAGHILIAPFVDVPTLVSTYSVAGTIPILGPLAKFSAVFDYLRTFIRDKWSTKDRLQNYVRINEVQWDKYRLTLIHAEDDYDIPWAHTPMLFQHAIQGTVPNDTDVADLMEKKSELKVDLGAAGSVVEWKTEHGCIREEILKFGLHDVIMGNPIITLAVLRIFESVKSDRALR